MSIIDANGKELLTGGPRWQDSVRMPRNGGPRCLPLTLPRFYEDCGMIQGL